HALAGGRVRPARGADAQGAQVVRRSGARVVCPGRAAQERLLPGAGGNRAIAAVRDGRADRRRAGGRLAGSVLMPIYLYLDRRTFIHRLHPTVKILAIVGIFWSVYWVDNPFALLPLGALLLAAAQFTRAWPN